MEYLRESVAVQEQIIRFGEDSEVRSAAMFNICFAYRKLGEMDKAIEQARKLPNLFKTRENALVHFLEGEEKRQVAREALVPLEWAVRLHLNALAETEGNAEWREKAEKISRMLREAE